MQRGGYVKLWRKTLDSGLLGHPFAFTLFGYLLLSCVRERWRYTTRYEVVDLEPGEWIIGRKKLSKELGMSEQNLRTALRLLADMKILTIKSTNEYSTIRLINYAKYQAMQSDLTTELTNSQPTANQQLTTKKEVREVREVKELNIRPEFEAWYAIYPKKEKGEDAFKAWCDLNPSAELQATMKGVIPAHIKAHEWNKPEKRQFIPLPASWIRSKRWLDQFESGPRNTREKKPMCMDDL